jgi:hypothetical protein
VPRDEREREDLGAALRAASIAQAYDKCDPAAQDLIDGNP